MKSLALVRDTSGHAARGRFRDGLWIACRAAVMCCFLCTSAICAVQQHVAGHPNAVPAPARPAQRAPGNTPGPRNQEHLAEWMNRHRDMSLPQQQRALENEPGFKEYPAQTQQRMRDRLSQLNNMPNNQRTRILERNEAMEHLAPNQRQQVRGAMLQLGALPEDRRKAVARVFRDLRAMPESQRQQYLNSPAYRGQFSEQERGTVGNLMAVEPYLPGHRPAETGPQ